MGEDSPIYDQQGGVSAVELIDKIFGDAVRVEAAAAGEDVYGCIAMLGPSVDAKVGLGDGHHAGHALGVEFVEGLSEDSGPHLLGGREEGFSNKRQVVQKDTVTVLQFQKQVVT